MSFNDWHQQQHQQQIARQQQEWFQQTQQAAAQQHRRWSAMRRATAAGGLGDDAAPLRLGPLGVVGIVLVLGFIAAVAVTIAMSVFSSPGAVPDRTRDDFGTRAEAECRAAGFSAEQCRGMGR